MGKIPSNEAELARLVNLYNSVHKTDLVVCSQKALKNHMDADFRESMDIYRQQVTDAALIALHDCAGFAEKRLKRFMTAFEERYYWLFSMAQGDINSYVRKEDKEHPELTVTKVKLEQELKAICGGSYVPWEERYGRWVQQ